MDVSPEWRLATRKKVTLWTINALQNQSKGNNQKTGSGGAMVFVHCMLIHPKEYSYQVSRHSNKLWQSYTPDKKCITKSLKGKYLKNPIGWSYGSCGLHSHSKFFSGQGSRRHRHQKWPIYVTFSGDKKTTTL